MPPERFWMDSRVTEAMRREGEAEFARLHGLNPKAVISTLKHCPKGIHWEPRAMTEEEIALRVGLRLSGSKAVPVGAT